MRIFGYFGCGWILGWFGLSLWMDIEVSCYLPTLMLGLIFPLFVLFFLCEKEKKD